MASTSASVACNPFKHAQAHCSTGTDYQDQLGPPRPVVRTACGVQCAISAEAEHTTRHGSRGRQLQFSRHANRLQMQGPDLVHDGAAGQPAVEAAPVVALAVPALLYPCLVSCPLSGLTHLTTDFCLREHRPAVGGGCDWGCGYTPWQGTCSSEGGRTTLNIMCLQC